MSAITVRKSVMSAVILVSLLCVFVRISASSDANQSGSRPTGNGPVTPVVLGLMTNGTPLPVSGSVPVPVYDVVARPRINVSGTYILFFPQAIQLPGLPSQNYVYVQVKSISGQWVEAAFASEKGGPFSSGYLTFNLATVMAVSGPQ